MIDRKAQTEILGLVIIVVLFIMGLLFAVTIMSKTPSGSDVKQRFYSRELAQNFLLAMLKTNVAECKGLTMTEILEDCNMGGYKCGNSKSSCWIFNTTLINILNRTLDVQQRDYFIKVYVYSGGTSRDLYLLERDCTEGMVGELGNQPIPLHPGTMEVDLFVCT